MTGPIDSSEPRKTPFWAWLLVALAIGIWVVFFLAPALPADRALLGVDLLKRFPPWDATVPPDWEARNHLLFDQTAQFYPWRLLTRRLAEAGLPPLWNPYAGTGSPLLANYQSATLAPVELFVSGIDPARASAIAAAIRLAVAGVGMLLLLRRFHLPPLAVVFGTIAFLGSGAITILLYHPNSNVSMWLPFVALLSYGLPQTKPGAERAGQAALLALVLGAHLLGGHPETSLYVSLASLLFFAIGILVPDRPVRGLLRAIGLLVVAHLLSIAIAAPQILPFLEYLEESAVLQNRAGERFFNPPLCSVGLVAPETFGTPNRPNTYFGPRNYHAVATQYAGLATAFLAFLAIAGGKPRRALTLTLGGVVALCICLIYPTPVWEAAGYFPLFRISANVTGLTLLTTFVMAILGACGIAGLIGSSPTESSRGARYLAIAAAFLAAGMLLATIVLPAVREKIFEIGTEKLRALYEGVTHAKPIEVYLARLPLVYDTIRTTLLRTGLMAAALAVIFLAAGRRKATIAAVIALLAHLAFDLSHFGRGYVPAIPRSEVFPTTPEIQALQRRGSELHRVMPTGRAMPPNTLTAYGIEDFRVHDAIGSFSHQRLEAAMSNAPLMRRPIGSYDQAFANVAGVDLFVAEREDTTANEIADTLGYWSNGAVTVFHNPIAWPRAFICPMAKDVANDEEALQAAVIAARETPGTTPTTVAMTTPTRTGSLVAPGFLWRIVELFWRGKDRTDLMSEAHADSSRLWREADITARSESYAALVGRLRHGPLRVDAEVDLKEPGWLVLLDQDYPGWRVTVDSKPARAGRAFGHFRAVEVPEGKHTVSWTYRPLSFALGLGLALLAIALAALMTTFALFRAVTRRDVEEAVESS